jgi:hypothetical protein
MPGASEATDIADLGDKDHGHDTPDAVDALDRLIAAIAHQLPVQRAFEARDLGGDPSDQLAKRPHPCSVVHVAELEDVPLE